MNKSNGTELGFSIDLSVKAFSNSIFIILILFLYLLFIATNKIKSTTYLSIVGVS